MSMSCSGYLHKNFKATHSPAQNNGRNNRHTVPKKKTKAGVTRNYEISENVTNGSDMCRGGDDGWTKEARKQSAKNESISKF